jgi:hypothetical protein
MENPMMLMILVIGVISAVFGLLLIIAPDMILKVEQQTNWIFMTEKIFLKNRIPIGIGLLVVSALLIYAYATESISQMVVLLAGILSFVFGLLLIFSPNTILKLERQANRVIMTDAFFMEHRIVIGIGLLFSSAYMIYTYLSFG